MINANELRIGNWVNFRNRKITGKSLYPYQIVFTDFKDVILKDAEFVFKDERLEPIPLSPEILEQCGFELQEGQIPFYKYGKLFMYFDGTSLSANFGHIEQFDVEIFYLHQLQNLYFALTGTELAINIK